MAVIGITSATVIQSMPSMKLTRLTNHKPPISSRSRSSPPRQERHDTELIGQGVDDARDHDSLQDQAQAGGKRPNIVDRAEASHDQHCRDNFRQVQVGRSAQRENCERDSDGAECRRDDGDAAALRRRRAMRRPGIRLGKRIALEPRVECDDQQRAHQRREDHDDRAAHEPPVAAAVIHRADLSPIIERI